MMIDGPMTDKEWQAKNDLETLIHAEKVKADPKRLKAAMSMKRKLKKDLEKVEG